MQTIEEFADKYEKQYELFKEAYRKRVVALKREEKAALAAIETKLKKCYLIGSLRNEYVPKLAATLRLCVPNTTEVFDDWISAGYEADDMWKAYEQNRPRSYRDALNGYAATHIFKFDKHHLDTSTHALLVLPAGKSGHMEVTYAKYGAGCKTGILLEEGADPRWDLMYKFIDEIFYTQAEVVEWLNAN